MQRAIFAARRKTRPPKALAKNHWFADLNFTRAGIIDRKTGRKIGTAEITPLEFIKFIGYLAVLLVEGAAVRLKQKNALRVYFAPDRPRPWHVVWSAAFVAGVRIADNIHEADACFRFEDKAVGSTAYANAINGACSNICKSHVALMFEAAAGYKMLIDPAAHTGFAVEKGEANGVHDGQIVQCPRPALAGKTYQLLIDNLHDGIALDYRTTVIGRRPLFVLIKTKPGSDRFSIHNTDVKFSPLTEVFSASEIELITRFAETMQLDWAALDVLRDRKTGRIYVVDVNTTDMGPAVDLSLRDRERLKRAISAAFLRLVVEKPSLNLSDRRPA